MDINRNKVEAVLFACGKDMTVDEIASLCNLTEDKTKKAILKLKEEYEHADHSLMIQEKGKFYKCTIKEDYVPLVSSIITQTELDQSTLQTLAVIAWNYPILQADIIKIRGAKAYEHMGLLEDNGFIAKEKISRTFKVKLTNKFFQYFDIPSDKAKEAFKSVLPKEAQEQIAEKIEEINQTETDLKEAMEMEKTAKEELKQEKEKTKKDKVNLEEELTKIDGEVKDAEIGDEHAEVLRELQEEETLNTDWESAVQEDSVWLKKQERKQKKLEHQSKSLKPE